MVNFNKGIPVARLNPRAKQSPTSKEPINPGARVTAMASISLRVIWALTQAFAHHPMDEFYLTTGSNFRDDAAKTLMVFKAGGNDIGKHLYTVGNNRGRSFITGSFNT